MVRTIIILFLLFVSYRSIPQVLPREGSRLNYRLIGFSFPRNPQAATNRIEIAEGNITSVDSFTKKIIKWSDNKSNKVILEVPSFGSNYTWRVVYELTENKVIGKSALHHFSTQTNARIDTTKFRLKILHPAEQHADDYVAVDNGGVLYDMAGAPVWFIPDTNGYGGIVADLKFTADGTITFLYKDAYEINYNGDLLWKAPNKGIVSGDTAVGEFYHHEFTKLSNGHYMLLGMEFLMCRQETINDSAFITTAHYKNEQDGFRRGRFGTLIEYDGQGNIVWSWKSSGYLIGSDFVYFKGIDSALRFDPHDNAFFFDEKNKNIYFGLRNMNKVIKIEYPSGKVLRTYGENFKPGVQGLGSGLFCNQHNVMRSMDGYLYFFNNNSCRTTNNIPTVVMLQEPATINDTFKKIWEYTCPIDDSDYPATYQKVFASGGNVIELPDRSMFINMGSMYSRLLIVNRDKKILWSALPQRYMFTDRKWTAQHEYRATIISRRSLEKMIWKAELPHG